MNRLKYPINITFDTNIFDSNQFDLGENSAFFKLRKYVEQGKIRVYLSNIVLNEMRQHYIEYARKIYSKIRKTRGEIQNGKFGAEEGKKLHGISDDFVSAIGLSYILKIPEKSEILNSAENYFNNYISSLQIEKLNSQNINLDNIFHAYFNKLPPFENTENKKYEFPDAVIAEQIKLKFNENNFVYVVTQDKGLSSALKDKKYCYLINSLDKVFDMISKQEEEYDLAFNEVNTILPQIRTLIEEKLEDDSNISLDGLSYDKDGIVEGFDYDEVYYLEHELEKPSIFAIDYFDENTLCVRLNCVVKIKAECTYNDYDNSCWDSEEKEYLYLESITNVEIHKARFACDVNISRSNSHINSLKFHVFLGGDSIIERYVES